VRLSLVFKGQVCGPSIASAGVLGHHPLGPSSFSSFFFNHLLYLKIYIF